MKQKINIKLELNNMLTISCDCEYSAAVPKTWEYPGDESKMEITGMEFIKGGLFGFTDWANEYCQTAFRKEIVIHPDTIWEFLERICLLQYEASL